MWRNVQDAVRTLFSNSMGSPVAQTRRPTSDGMYLTADLGQPTPDSSPNCHPSSITIIPESFAAATVFYLIDKIREYSIEFARIKN